MTDAQVRTAVLSGRRAADVAREAGLPLTTVHRIAHERGVYRHAALQIACDRCGQITTFRGGIYAMCGQCREETQSARAIASTAVRKAVAVGMLRPAKDCMCVDCGAAAEHYDHRDYSKPLAVEPVCRSCNAKRGAAA